MEKQVLSIKQMRHLQKLGVDTSKASAYYYNGDDKMVFFIDNIIPVNSVLTFTLQDMLEMIADIPNFYKIKIAHEEDDGWCFGIYGGIKYINDYQTNLLDLTYQTLCWLAKNNYIGGNK